MQLAANNATPVARHRADDDAAYQFAGLLIVSLFPALFWTVLLAAGGAAVGYAPSALMLTTVGAAIAAFLAAVAHSLFAKA